ncbi:MAG: hypothetical protein P4L98_17085 [Ancalomicrobiaceae bacterium]|nr:hypothetical protein [Ancalomicrobiaceae bacterium]
MASLMAGSVIEPAEFVKITPDDISVTLRCRPASCLQGFSDGANGALGRGIDAFGGYDFDSDRRNNIESAQFDVV